MIFIAFFLGYLVAHWMYFRGGFSNLYLVCDVYHPWPLATVLTMQAALMFAAGWIFGLVVMRPAK